MWGVAWWWWGDWEVTGDENSRGTLGGCDCSWEAFEVPQPLRLFDPLKKAMTISTWTLQKHFSKVK